MKIIIKLILLILVCLCLVGCGDKKLEIIKDIKDNTLIISKEDTITEIACEDFNGTNIDIKDLQNQIEDGVEKFNSNNGKKSITFLEYSDDNGFISVALEYKNISQYNKYNNTNYVVDNLESSVIEGTFTSANGTLYEANAIPKEDNMQVISISDKINLSFKGEILYYNSNVTISDKNNAVTNGEGAAIIIYKN